MFVILSVSTAHKHVDGSCWFYDGLTIDLFKAKNSALKKLNIHFLEYINSVFLFVFLQLILPKFVERLFSGKCFFHCFQVCLLRYFLTLPTLAKIVTWIESFEYVYLGS